MKKIILSFLFLFYKYYDKGSTKNIAYESALMVLIFVLFLNAFAVAILVGVDKYLPETTSTAIWRKYLVGFAIFLPFYFVSKKIFPKEDILKVEMNSFSIKKGYFIIVIYIICSVFFLIWVINSK